MLAADAFYTPERLPGESWGDYQMRRKMQHENQPPEPAYTTRRQVDLNRATRILNKQLGARQVRKLQKQARRAAKP